MGYISFGLDSQSKFQLEQLVQLALGFDFDFDLPPLLLCFVEEGYQYLGTQYRRANCPKRLILSRLVASRVSPIDDPSRYPSANWLCSAEGPNCGRVRYLVAADSDINSAL